MAFGVSTKALGTNSSAFGVNSDANGYNSFAFGVSAVANGNNAFAFGVKANAQGDDSFAIGDGSYTSGTSVNSSVTGDGANVYFSPYAFVYGTDSTAFGAPNSFAYGTNSTVGRTDNATAFGTNSLAQGKNSMAFGSFSLIGTDTPNGMAMGVRSKAKLDNAMAFGTSSSANGVNTIAFGANSNTFGENSLTLGSNSSSNGVNAYSIGTGAVGNGTNVSAIGANSTAIGVNSAALGTSATAAGVNTLALGTGSYATGYNSNSTAIGTSSYADGTNVLALGVSSVALSNNSIAIGTSAHAVANSATAIGTGSQALAPASTAIGYQSVATRPYQVALGSTWSPYSLPGLSPGGSFVGSTYQNSGEKKFVTSDNWGTLGTSSFNVNELVNSIGTVGALSSALGALPSSTLLPDESIRCGIGTGTYGGQFAGSLGCAARMADRLYLNGGIAMSQTTSVAGGAMGRLGFSIGFGGKPPAQKQQQLSEIPGLNKGSSFMEFGNGSNSPAEQDFNIQAPATKPLADGLIMAKTNMPTIINPLVIASSKSEALDIDRLRQRLHELEKEITTLRAGTLNSSSDDKIKALTVLVNEKEFRQKELSNLLAQMRKQLNDQQKTIDLLLKRISKS
jgi:hypothetical protein